MTGRFNWGIGTSRSDAEVFGRCKDRPTIYDDDLLINSDHPVLLVYAVEREPEGFTLPEPSTSAQENEQRAWWSGL